MKPEAPYTWGFIFRVVIKAMVLWVVANLLFAWSQPIDFLGRLSLYNILFAGRERLPYGENTTEAYTITLDNISTMFATHKINRPKADDEYRVLLVGDSATCGFLLSAHQTLAQQLTDRRYLYSRWSACGGIHHRPSRHVHGVMWQSTGIDHVWGDNALRRNDFDDDDSSWEEFDAPQTLSADNLAFDMIVAGHDMVGDIPLIIVNEPMFIADGRNSNVRYNHFYPRWAYNQYRELFTQLADEHNWNYCDVWDAMPPDSFTDSPVHMTADATGTFSQILGVMITDYLEFGYLGRECD